MPRAPGSITLDMKHSPPYQGRDPRFYSGNTPTAVEGPPMPNGDLGFEGLAPPRPVTGGSPFKLDTTKGGR